MHEASVGKKNHRHFPRHKAVSSFQYFPVILILYGGAVVFKNTPCDGNGTTQIDHGNSHGTKSILQHGGVEGKHDGMLSPVSQGIPKQLPVKLMRIKSGVMKPSAETAHAACGMDPKRQTAVPLNRRDASGDESGNQHPEESCDIPAVAGKELHEDMTQRMMQSEDVLNDGDLRFLV